MCGGPRGFLKYVSCPGWYTVRAASDHSKPVGGELLVILQEEDVEAQRRSLPGRDGGVCKPEPMSSDSQVSACSAMSPGLGMASTRSALLDEGRRSE